MLRRDLHALACRKGCGLGSTGQWRSLSSVTSSRGMRACGSTIPGWSLPAKTPGLSRGLCDAGPMQWHWGNIGSAAPGLATLIVTVRLLWSAPDWYRTWKGRQNAERDLAREQTGAIQLERRRHLSGWSGHGVDTFGVTLVTAKDELARACAELASNQPSAFVVMRVSEGGDGHDANRAHSLRQIIGTEGYISRPPTTGEREALEKGLDAMDIPRAAYGQARPARPTE